MGLSVSSQALPYCLIALLPYYYSSWLCAIPLLNRNQHRGSCAGEGGAGEAVGAAFGLPEKRIEPG